MQAWESFGFGYLPGPSSSRKWENSDRCKSAGASRQTFGGSKGKVHGTMLRNTRTIPFIKSLVYPFPETETIVFLRLRVSYSQN